MHKTIRTLIAGAALAASVFAAPLAQAAPSFHGSSSGAFEVPDSLNPSPGNNGGGGGGDGGINAPGSLSAQEQAIFADINAYRAGHGIAPITWNDGYHAEAVDWGHTMNNGGFFGHPDGLQRFENLYFTPGSALEATEAWKNSPGHNANMLNPELRNGAVGIVAGSLPGYGSGYFVVMRGYF